MHECMHVTYLPNLLRALFVANKGEAVPNFRHGRMGRASVLRRGRRSDGGLTASRQHIQGGSSELGIVVCILNEHMI